MAYGLRLTTGFKDQTHAQSEWDLEVWQKDYEGEAEEFEEMGAAPVTINYGDSTRWPLPTIPSDMDFELWASTRFQFDDLVDPDATKNMVVLKHSGSVYWKGYIVTDLYEEYIELVSGPVRLSAADLKLVENYAFALTGWKTHFEIVRYCLNKLGFDFGFRVATSLKTESTNLDMLRVYQNDCAIFSELNCLGVLEVIMKAHFTTVYQAGGKWVIVGYRTKAENYAYVDFDKDGVQTGTGTFGGTVATTGQSESAFCIIMAGGAVQKLPPLKKFTIEQTLGLRENLVENGDFSEYRYLPLSGGLPSPVPTFDHWVANCQVEHNLMEDQHWCLIKSFKTTGMLIGDNHIKQVFPDFTEFSFNAEQYIKILAKYALIGDTSIEDEDLGEIKGNLACLVKAGSYYLKKRYDAGLEKDVWEWSGIEAAISLSIGEKRQDLANVSFNSFSVVAPLPPGGGKIEIRLYEPSLCEPEPLVWGPNVIQGAAYTGVKVSFCDVDGNGLEDKYEFEHLVDGKNSYVPDNLEVMAGNAPPEIPANQLLAFENIVIPQMEAKYGNYVGTLQEMLAQQITDMFASVPLKLDANIDSDLLTIDSIITESTLPGRRFMPVAATFYPREANWHVEAISVNTEDEINPDFLYPDFDDQDWNAG